jgi:hypothetical protein
MHSAPTLSLRHSVPPQSASFSQARAPAAEIRASQAWRVTARAGSQMRAQSARDRQPRAATQPRRVTSVVWGMAAVELSIGQSQPSSGQRSSSQSDTPSKK